MRKQTPILIASLCVSLGVYLVTRGEPRPFFTETIPVVITVPMPIQPNPAPSAALVAADLSLPAPVSATPVFPEMKTRQHVFRLQLDRGKCTLEKVEEISGAFGRERVPQWQTGMLCCRLIAEDGRIVGERTLHAPDYVCVVLDPNDASKEPAAARLTSDGPATFQVRFPEITDAVRLEVHRIATETRPADAATPVGLRIASIAIPPK